MKCELYYISLSLFYTIEMLDNNPFVCLSAHKHFVSVPYLLNTFIWRTLKLLFRIIQYSHMIDKCFYHAYISKLRLQVVGQWNAIFINIQLLSCTTVCILMCYTFYSSVYSNYICWRKQLFCFVGHILVTSCDGSCFTFFVFWWIYNMLCRCLNFAVCRQIKQGLYNMC